MSSDRERPKLAWELASEAAKAGNRNAYASLPRPPHCDPRILHAPSAGCDFCVEAVELQAERERLEISNSGMANRKWPCPADQARGKAHYEAWGGNKPKTYKQIEEEAAAFAAQLEAMGLVVK